MNNQTNLKAKIYDIKNSVISGWVCFLPYRVSKDSKELFQIVWPIQVYAALCYISCVQSSLLTRQVINIVIIGRNLPDNLSDCPLALDAK